MSVYSENRITLCSECIHHRVRIGNAWTHHECNKIIDWTKNEIELSPIFNDLKTSNATNSCQYFEENLTAIDKAIRRINSFFKK